MPPKTGSEPSAALFYSTPEQSIQILFGQQTYICRRVEEWAYVVNKALPVHRVNLLADQLAPVLVSQLGSGPIRLFERVV